MTASPVIPSPAEDRFVMPTRSAKAESHASQSSNAQIKLWILILFHWLPALGVAYAVQRFNWQGNLRIRAYGAGLILTLACYQLVMRWLGTKGRVDVRQALRQELHDAGIVSPDPPPLAVGVSPGSVPRFYVTSYNWDTGLLLLSRDKLYFWGQEIHCALNRAHIRELRQGPGAPSWFPMERVYLRWRDSENGREGTLNFASAEPATAFEVGKKGRELHDLLWRWKQGSISSSSITQLNSLQSPAIGEVTSRSPKKLLTPGKALSYFFVLMVPSAAVGCMLAGVRAFWYVILATFLVRIYEQLPYWLYRERPVFGDMQAHGPVAGSVAVAAEPIER